MDTKMTYLNNFEIKKLESELHLRRETMMAGIRQHLHRSDDPKILALANHLEESGDWAAADLLNDTDIGQLSHELIELRDIDTALSRIKVGSYGVCIGCSTPIALERMRAQPTAQYCLTCQENVEKHQGVTHSAYRY